MPVPSKSTLAAPDPAPGASLHQSKHPHSVCYAQLLSERMNQLPAAVVTLPEKYLSKWEAPKKSKDGFTAEAVIQGLELDRICRGISEGLFDISQRDIESIGGVACFHNIFIRAYERFFLDPHLSQLFNETPSQRSPEEHGKLLGGFLLLRIAQDDTYVLMRRAGYGHGLGEGHRRARMCPLRPEEDRGRRFLRSQALAWLGHVSIAVDEVLSSTNDSKIRHAFKLKLMNGLKDAVWEMYSPFVMDNVDAYLCPREG